MATEGSVDFLEPWTVKSMSRRTRLQILSAARKEELTAAQWLDRRMAEWLAGGMPTVVGPGQTSEDDLGRLRQLVEMARILAPEGKDTALLREARAAVRERLKGLRLKTPPQLEAPTPEVAPDREGEGE